MYVRQRRNLMLWDREMVRRRNFLKMLKSEDEYMCDQASKMQTVVKSKGLAKKIDTARRVLGNMHEKHVSCVFVRRLYLFAWCGVCIFLPAPTAAPTDLCMQQIISSTGLERLNGIIYPFSESVARCRRVLSPRHVSHL